MLEINLYVPMKAAWILINCVKASITKKNGSPSLPPSLSALLFPGAGKNIIFLSALEYTRSVGFSFYGVSIQRLHM